MIKRNMLVLLLMAGMLLPACQLVAQSAGDAPILLPEEGIPDPISTSEHNDLQSYTSGEKKIRRQIRILSDNTVVNHGPYTEWYRTGQEFSQGQFLNGARDGNWTFWFEDGTKCKSVNYKNGLPHGKWEVFREDGKLRAKREYVDGKKNGNWLLFAADGTTEIQQESYTNGVADGKWVKRFANGDPQQEENFANGQRHGTTTVWNEQGDVVREINFKDGKLHGRYFMQANGRTITQYYRDGQLDVNRNGGSQ